MRKKMGGGLVLVVLAVWLRPCGADGWRHDGVFPYSKHSRAANPRRVTPEQQNNTVVLAQVGRTATIKCYTHYLGDEMVTWMKRDEDQLLTAGGQVYSSEDRYAVTHVRHQRLWELSVRDVRQSDAGLYECQLTTHPPASLFFTLKVVEARAVIGGGPEVHVHTGGRLRLHCTVELATEPPDYIFWFHNNTMINYSPRRPLRVVKHHLASSLVISNVTWEDAGSYTCEPHLARPANLTLHVVEGFEPMPSRITPKRTQYRDHRTNDRL
ncbi:zwei Ig domain protein zig-8 isoform X2 [Procambarus clarkii]|uniref:zwei Ig domain protein zig-8 isoform X2 n=1 Tax=Procambarus clarkii TaxID=6728 RepID=UPI0037435826